MDRRRLLRPYTLFIRTVDGEKVTHRFWKSLQNLGGRARDSKILGPLYGERQVQVRAKSVSHAPLQPWIYPAFSPWQGFGYRLAKDKKSSKSKAQRIILEIE